jgi:hypothetical protein
MDDLMCIYEVVWVQVTCVYLNVTSCVCTKLGCKRFMSTSSVYQHCVNLKLKVVFEVCD